MQVPLPADTLVPLGAGGLVVLALLVAGLVVLVRRRRAHVAPPPPATSAAPQPGRTTVAHAVAIREADTAPLPVSSADVLARAEGKRAAEAAEGPEAPSKAVKSREPGPEVDPNAQPDPVAPKPAPPAEPSVQPPGDDAGSSKPVAEAVVQAFAVRAAGRERAANPASPEQPLPLPDRPPAPRGDARDRLLAVLLDDPARTLGAAADLEASRVQLARLTAAMTYERGVLEELLAKLSAAGLAPEQLASLAGMPADEVRKLLSAGRAGPPA